VYRGVYTHYCHTKLGFPQTYNKSVLVQYIKAYVTAN